MVQIRTANLDDVKGISRVLALSWKTAYRGIVDDIYLDALRDDHWISFLTTGLNDGSIFSMVIENNRELIGAAILSGTKKEPEAKLISFYLSPDRIGQGFGHLFYNAIEDELKNRGFLGCVIEVLENNTQAIRFYKAHGFVDTGKTVSAPLGESSYGCIVMEKPLGV